MDPPFSEGSIVLADAVEYELWEGGGEGGYRRNG
jgi:hypothetical protein